VLYFHPFSNPELAPAPPSRAGTPYDPRPHRRPVSRPDYLRIRHQAQQLAAADAAARTPPVHVRITDIDDAALSAFAVTWHGGHWSGYGGFDWVHLWHRFGRQEGRSFHCALWHGSVLCGLAIGSVPRGHSHLTIRYIEGRPQVHPLRGHVARTALSAAEYYADGLGVPRIRLENPAPDLERWYRELGFTLAYREGAVRYLAMELPRDGA
jgi:hypothetical protein